MNEYKFTDAQVAFILKQQMENTGCRSVTGQSDVARRYEAKDYKVNQQDSQS